MSLERHFESYRHSVKRDVLDGYIEYANQAIYVDGHTTATRLKELKRECELEAARGNAKEYNEHLRDHRHYVKYTFETMVKNKYDELIKEGKLPEIAILDIAWYKGWNWFKFLHPVMIRFDKLIIAPRHRENESFYQELPVFDADEMRVIMENSVSVEQAENILAIKMNRQKEGKPMKLLVPKDHQGTPHFAYLKIINESSVIDWVREDIYYGK